jgi:hypothetical protein
MYRRAPSVQLSMLTNKRAMRDRGAGRTVHTGRSRIGAPGRAPVESHVTWNSARLDSGPHAAERGCGAGPRDAVALVRGARCAVRDTGAPTVPS